MSSFRFNSTDSGREAMEPSLREMLSKAGITQKKIAEKA
jgi:hypothetical protein